MADLVLSNYLCNNRATSVQTLLNAGSRLRFFKSSHTPSPADVLSTYTGIEANFDTYPATPISLASWTGPTLAVNGQYQLLSAIASYSSPASLGNTLYGLFVDDGGSNLLFALAFASSINYAVGAPALSAQIAYSVWSESLHP